MRLPFFSNLLSFNLRSYIFQSAGKCEMTSSYMMSLHVNLNEATKCVDIIPLTSLPSLTHLRTLVQNMKRRRCLASLAKIHHPIYESLGASNLERTHDCYSAVGKVAF